MQAEGFLARRERHPVALTAAVAINLTAVGALLLAKGEYVKLPPRVIELITVTEAPPPEIRPRPPEPPVAARPSRPDPAVETPLPPLPEVDLPALPPVELAGTGAGGAGMAGTPGAAATPTLPPVLTEAAVDPRYAGQFQPAYPARLERLGIEGRVVLNVLIGTDGRVKDVRILLADDDGFADATERQARAKWRFRPATRDGAPVEAWKRLTVRFEIGRG
jgi:protein TonB